jgi:hypothetical protein
MRVGEVTAAKTPPKPAPRVLAAAALLLAVFAFQCFTASRLKSPVVDEPPHIAAGLSNVEKHVFVVNVQHPPLMKELAGISMRLAGIRWPENEQSRSLLGGRADLAWPVGNDIIISGGPDRVLFWARLPAILLATMLGIVIFAWTRSLFGDAAALGALFLYTLDPILLAHSYLVTTDVPLAAFGTLFLFCLWRYAGEPTRGRLLLCGVTLGASLAAKFSGMMLVPLAAVLLLAAHLVNPWSAAGPLSGLRARLKAGALLLLRFAAICAIAALVVEAVYLFPSDPLLYFKGYRQVNYDHDPRTLFFLAGALSRHFYSYFVAAYLLKEPLAAIALAAAGVALLLLRRSGDTLLRLFLLLPPLAWFLGYTVGADDIGVRYLIPALPFACILGGAALGWLVRRRSVWTRAAAAALCGWIAVAALAIYPDHLAYFNETACLFADPSSIGLDGGTSCGPYWLADSNVDWGQGLKQLKVWLERNPGPSPVRFVYFGSFPPEPYGIPGESKAAFRDLMSLVPVPGRWVVSAHYLAVAEGYGERFYNGGGAWLREYPPTAIVGRSLYVIDVPAGQ